MERGVWVSYSWGNFPGVSGSKVRCLGIRGSSKEPKGGNRIYEYIVLYSNAEMKISFAKMSTSRDFSSSPILLDSASQPQGCISSHVNKTTQYIVRMYE